MNSSRQAKALYRANAGHVRTWSQVLMLILCCTGHRKALIWLVVLRGRQRARWAVRWGYRTAIRRALAKVPYMRVSPVSMQL